MQSGSNLVSKVFTVAGLAVCLCFFQSTFVQAQSDKERPFAEAVKSTESVLMREKVTTDYHVPRKVDEPVVEEERDLSGYRKTSEVDEKGVKSETKSTLSFNLFLYVVDRFKEK
ncbi:hypothetical protein [Lunatimonas salinarum]|uniref:hypothetical protein n=1 Tax=Lunatimonas salinarum TaxID=1774590 RepID=UPI001ADFF12F|nr:hypothetical protein [Lunatimonas salinarum]